MNPLYGTRAFHDVTIRSKDAYLKWRDLEKMPADTQAAAEKWVWYDDKENNPAGQRNDSRSDSKSTSDLDTADETDGEDALDFEADLGGDGSGGGGRRRMWIAKLQQSCIADTASLIRSPASPLPSSVPSHSTTVVLKQYHISNDSELRQFRRAVHIMSTLSGHPNIVPLQVTLVCICMHIFLYV